MKIPVGVQLYSIANAFKLDYEDTLRRVAEAGFDGVEFAGYSGVPASHMRAALEKYGLKPIASHIQFQTLQEDFDSQIKYADELGMKNIVCPIIKLGELDNAEETSTFSSRLGQIAEKLADAGLRFYYHNHWMEFRRAGNSYIIEQFKQECKSPNFYIELDMFWTKIAGVDPLYFLYTNYESCQLVHYKDYCFLPKQPLPEKPTEIQKILDTLVQDSTVIQVPVGEGNGDYDRATEFLASKDAIEGIIVEQEIFQGDPFTCLAKSCRWIKEQLNKNSSGSDYRK
jgi:sugar phosphate isomerase/epimerase